MFETTKGYCDLYSDSEIERNDARMYRPKPTAKEMLADALTGTINSCL